MSTVQELQQRWAVAAERNRQNKEKLDALLAEIKEKWDCDSVDELRTLLAERQANAEKLNEEAEKAQANAEQLVAEVERAVQGG